MAAKDGGVRATFLTALVMQALGVCVLIGFPAWPKQAGAALIIMGVVIMFAGAAMRKHARRYSDTHFREFAELFSKLKTKAMRLDPNEKRPAEDAPVEVTILGVRTTYDVTKVEHGFAHQVNLSLHRHRIPYGLGGTLACFAARLMKVPQQRLVMAHPNTVHMGFVLADREHEELELSEVTLPEYEELAQLRKDAITDMRRIQGDTQDEPEDRRLLQSEADFRKALGL